MRFIVLTILALLLGIALAKDPASETECEKQWKGMGVWPMPVPCRGDSRSAQR
jgi:hypothetical protein